MMASCLLVIFRTLSAHPSSQRVTHLDLLATTSRQVTLALHYLASKDAMLRSTLLSSMAGLPQLLVCEKVVHRRPLEPHGM